MQHITIQPHILAGGESSRFGEDKSLHRWHDRALIDHTIDAVSLALPWEELWIGLRFTAERPRLVSHLSGYTTRFLEDRTDLQGPLASLAAAFAWGSRYQRDWVLALAVDMPALTPAIVQGLIDIARRSPEAAAVVPRPAVRFWPRLQPLCALYRPNPALEALEASVRAGSMRAIEFAESIPGLRVVEVEELERFDPAWERAFMNANTPADLKAIDDF